MKAILLRTFGLAQDLKVSEIGKPDIQENQVLIRVKAAGVNPVDAKIRAGSNRIAQGLKLPVVLGFDFSGMIESCGKNVQGWNPGDEVLGCLGFPTLGQTYAEYVAANVEQLVRKPREITFEEAAGLPIAGLTAYQVIREHLHLQRGQKILIHAAAGGVGHLAVQIAKNIGAYIYATASEKNFELLYKLGADRCIEYHQEDFTQIVQEPDVVLEAIGGQVLYRSIESMKLGGRLACLPSSTMNDPRALTLAEQRGVQISWPIMRPDTQQLELLTTALQKKELQVHIERSFDIEQANQAHLHIESHRTVGKIVLKMNE